MIRPFSRWLVVTMAAVAAVAIVPAGLVWACVGLMSLTTSSSTVEPGGTVTVFGKEFAQGAPVEIHLDSATGPVLATVPPPSSTMTSQFNVTVTIPADVQKGQHLLVATQDYHHMNAGVPARAVLYVGTDAPPPPAPAERPAALAVSSGPSGVDLVLIGLAVAAGALLLAGLLNLLAARRRPHAAGAGA